MSLRRSLGLKDGERLLSVTRATPITLSVALTGALVVFLTPFFFLPVLLRWEILGYVIIVFLLILGGGVGLRVLIKWYGSFLAVTDRRLIITRRRGFFEKQVTELPYGKIHEVAYRVKGFFATIFSYGSILIESAGSDEPIEMACVHRPSALQDLLTELQEQSGRGRGDFGEMLQAVSRLDRRKLMMLKSEISRALSALPPEDGG
jgi:membrane protein YdbS with pleckstrin-like domain